MDSERHRPQDKGPPRTPPAGTETTPLSSYAEFLPSAALSRYLLCTWCQAIAPGATTYRHRVLPDGCIDLVWIGDAPPVVVGPATSSVIVPLAPRTVVVGARIRPGYADVLLGFSAHEALNREIPLADVWGRAALELTERVQARSSPAAKRAELDGGLVRFGASASAGDAAAVAAVAWLAAHPAGRVRELARVLACSPRHLHRVFAAAVGYGPKTFQRIVRFQRLLAMAREPSPAVNLAELAAGAGYADQAHMTREVHQFAGRTPSALLGSVGSTLAMSDLFNTCPDT